MRTAVGAFALVLSVAACERDPASQVHLALQGLPRTAAVPSRGAIRPWDARVCPQPATSPEHPGVLEFGGPCAFAHPGPFNCWSSVDDFYVGFGETRPSLTSFHVNVEHFTGPGEYDDAEIHLTIEDGASVYRFSTHTARVTVEPDRAGVTFQPVVLEREPGTRAPADITLRGRTPCAPAAPSGEHAP